MAERGTSTVWDVKPGEVLRFASGIEVKVVHKSGRFARLRVVAPPEDVIRKDRAEGDAEPAANLVFVGA